MSEAFSMANMQALNSASKGEACPIFCALAPKKVEEEFLKITPIDPQAGFPKEEQTQFIMMQPEGGGDQATS